MLRFAPALVLSTVLGHVVAATERRPVWFVSWQHTGHIKALVPVAAELQARGWEVRVAVHEEMHRVVPKDLKVVSAGKLPWTWDQELTYRRTLWDPLPMPESDDDDEQKASGSGDQTPKTSTDDMANAERKAQFSERYFTGSQWSLVEGLNATIQGLPKEQWPGLFAVDVSSVGAADLAEYLGVPYVIISGWPVGPTLHAIADPSRNAYPWMPSELFVFTQSASQQSFFDRLKRFLATLLVPRLINMQGFHEPRRELRRRLNLEPMIELLEPPRIPPLSERPLVAVLSHWGLDRPRPMPSNVVLVGPVEDYQALAAARPELQKEVSLFLAEGRQQGAKTLYISFGTNVQPRRETLGELAAAMSQVGENGIRFLWDIGREDVEDLFGDSHSLDHVLFAKGVDQLAVLAGGAVDGFVSHCGLNSVHEAMHFGVPILALPFLGDQLVAARLVEERGAGLRLNVARLSSAPLADAMRAIAFDENGHFKSSARRVGGLGRLAGGAKLAADNIEAVALHGSTHLQTIRDQHEGSGRLWDVGAALFASFCSFLVMGKVAFCGRASATVTSEAGACSKCEGTGWIEEQVCDNTVQVRCTCAATAGKVPAAKKKKKN